MENDYGQLIVHLINKDKLPKFQTTKPYWCNRNEVMGILQTLELEGNILNKKKIYFKNKHFKY